MMPPEEGETEEALDEGRVETALSKSEELLLGYFRVCDTLPLSLLLSKGSNESVLIEAFIFAWSLVTEPIDSLIN